MSLNSRAQEVRHLVKAGNVSQAGNAWIIPSKSKPAGTWYQVFLTWQPPGLRASCAETNPLGQGPCKGASNNHICRHVLAAVVARAEKAGKIVAFCEDLDKAERLSRAGGKVHRLYSGQGKGACFIVVK